MAPVEVDLDGGDPDSVLRKPLSRTYGGSAWTYNGTDTTRTWTSPTVYASAASILAD